MPLCRQILPELFLLTSLLLVDSGLPGGGGPDIPDADAKKHKREDGAAVMAQEASLPAPFEELVKLVAVPVEEHVFKMENTHARHKHDPVTIP